jgi:hypothetical protein
MQNMIRIQLSRCAKTSGFIIVTLLLVSSLVNAESGYKCVDAQGNITYSELALAGADCSPIGKAVKTTTDPDAAMQKLRDQVKAVEDSSASETQADSAAATRQQNCDLARKNQEVLEGPGDVVTTDAAGNKSIMGADDRTTALQQARKDVGYWCDS